MARDGVSTWLEVGGAHGSEMRVSTWLGIEGEHMARNESGPSHGLRLSPSQYLIRLNSLVLLSCRVVQVPRTLLLK